MNTSMNSFIEYYNAYPKVNHSIKGIYKKTKLLFDLNCAIINYSKINNRHETLGGCETSRLICIERIEQKVKSINICLWNI